MNNKDLSDAVYVCLTQSDGVMVFDITHIIERGTWEDLKNGIDRAESENNR